MACALWRVEDIRSHEQRKIDLALNGEAMSFVDITGMWSGLSAEGRNNRGMWIQSPAVQESVRTPSCKKVPDIYNFPRRQYQFMKKQITNKILSILFEKVSTFVNKQIDEHVWERLFVESGEQLISHGNYDELINDLRVTFSADNLTRIAGELHGSSSYTLPIVLHDQLYKLMMRYGIPHEESEAYIHHFIEIVIGWLEQEKPDEYERVYLGECRREFSEQYQHILSAIEELGESVKELKDKDVKALTIDDIERRIITRAKYRNLGLLFFETDDDLFDKEFSIALRNNEESIYVVGDNIEETFYRVCNKIKENGLRLNTLIIEQEEEWLRLEETGIVGKVLIPHFISDEIPVINNNINIFIYNRDIPVYKDSLTLRRRTRSNLVSALDRIGVENASFVYDNTHGLYSAIKKRLFKDASYSQPEWIRNPSKSVMAALLCGKWTECEGDRLVLEELSGLKYDEFLESIYPYTHGEKPLLIQIEGYGGNSWQLASVNDAWEELDSHIQAELWSKFVNVLYEVLIVTEPLFENVPFSEHYVQRLLIKSQDWSQSLKQGMLRSLIMRAYYRSHVENQRDIDRLVTAILDTIDSMGKWGYISQYIDLLCEASPKAVLSKIEIELVKPTGLFELFKENSGDIFTGANYYINFLWTAEKLLQLKDYTVRTLEWLWKFNELNIEYKASNNPTDVLKRFFCAWYNCCPLSTDNKIRQADKAVKNYSKAWDIIASELPERNGSTFFPLASLHYRQGDEADQPTWEETNRLYVAYLQICIDNLGQRGADAVISNRWNIILEALPQYDDQIRENTLKVLIGQSRNYPDYSICNIKNKIRDIIHKHRYFHDADWSMPENAIWNYEDALSGLKTKEVEYEYTYLCFHNYNFPILHPIPYDKEDNQSVHIQNDEIRENEIKSGLCEFQERKLSVERLIQIVLSNTNTTESTLGEILAKYYNNGRFDDRIFQLLLKHDIKGYQLYRYVREQLNTGGTDVLSVYKRAKELDINEDQLVYILSLQIFGNEEHTLVYDENENIKRKYWEREGFCSIAKDFSKENLDKVLNECFQFGNMGSYTRLLYTLKDLLKNEELFNRLIKIKNADFIARHTYGSFSYEFEKLLSRLQEAYIDNQERAQQIGEIELIFADLLNWENMKCFQKEIKRDPVLYAQMNEIVFKKDDDSEDHTQLDEEREKFVSHIYRLYQKAEFCPTENDGKVSYDELKQWIEKFIELLEKQHQKSQWERRIGRLLSYSPVGMDGYMPCEAVRRIIEEYKSDEICEAYVIAERNKRGVFVASAGKEEMVISERFKRSAEALSVDYPWTAKIYRRLSEVYMQDAISERERAVYE